MRGSIAEQLQQLQAPDDKGGGGTSSIDANAVNEAEAIKRLQRRVPKLLRRDDINPNVKEGLSIILNALATKNVQDSIREGAGALGDSEKLELSTLLQSEKIVRAKDYSLPEPIARVQRSAEDVIEEVIARCKAVADETEEQRTERIGGVVDIIDELKESNADDAQALIEAVQTLVDKPSEDYDEFVKQMKERKIVPEHEPPLSAPEPTPLSTAIEPALAAAPVAAPAPVSSAEPTPARMPAAMSGRVMVAGRNVNYRVLDDGRAELTLPGETAPTQIGEGGFFKEKDGERVRDGAIVWQDGAFKRLNKAGLQAHRDRLKNPDRAAQKPTERIVRNERVEKSETIVNSAYVVFLEGLADGKQVGASFETTALDLHPTNRNKLAEMIEKKRGIPHGTLEGVMRTLELEDKRLGRNWEDGSVKNTGERTERTPAVEKALTNFETLHFTREKSLMDAYVEAKKGLSNPDLLSFVKALRDDEDIDQEALEEVLKRDRQLARAERRGGSSEEETRGGRVERASAGGRPMDEINLILETARKRLENSKKR